MDGAVEGEAKALHAGTGMPFLANAADHPISPKVRAAMQATSSRPDPRLCLCVCCVCACLHLFLLLLNIIINADLRRWTFLDVDPTQDDSLGGGV